MTPLTNVTIVPADSPVTNTKFYINGLSGYVAQTVGTANKYGLTVVASGIRDAAGNAPTANQSISFYVAGITVCLLDHRPRS